MYNTASLGILLSCLGCCYLDMLDKLQKRVCRTFGLSLTACFEPLAYCRNLASLIPFYRYYFGTCSLELAEMVPIPHSCGTSTRYSNRLHDLSVTIHRCFKNVSVNHFFSHTARHWKYLPEESFSLTYDLNRFKYRFNRYFSSLGPF